MVSESWVGGGVGAGLRGRLRIPWLSDSLWEVDRGSLVAQAAFLSGSLQVVQGTPDRCEEGPGYMGVDLRGSGALVAQEILDNSEIGAPFQEVGGKAVPERMRRYFLLDSCCRCGVFHDPLNRPGSEMVTGAASGE